jgi:hypothetical protein
MGEIESGRDRPVEPILRNLRPFVTHE